MSMENSQPCHTPSELLNTLNASQSNIDQLLSVGIVTTSQPSSIQFNSTNMISDIQENDRRTGTQHAGQEQRHQQTQARRQPQQQEERQRLRQQQQQEQRERQRQRQERNQRRYERWQERVAQRQQERNRQEQEEHEHYAYLQRRSPNFDELMDDILGERELEEYSLERMTPQDRREVWEQEHLNQLQGNPTSRAHRLPLDDTERYAKFLHDQLWQDQHDQTMRVYDMENNDYAKQCRRNQELLRQKEEWDDLASRHQQI
ncbi:unnamed protein product [Rotaria sp. Silwood1]|nr:unnamed protein product [Rotaria sp. Silwood1]